MANEVGHNATRILLRQWRARTNTFGFDRSMIPLQFTVAPDRKSDCLAFSIFSVPVPFLTVLVHFGGLTVLWWGRVSRLWVGDHGRNQAVSVSEVSETCGSGGGARFAPESGCLGLGILFQFAKILRVCNVEALRWQTHILKLYQVSARVNR